MSAFAPIVLDGWLPPRELSPNARVHWRRKAGFVRQARLMGWSSARQVGWPAHGADAPRRRLTITIRRPRLMDHDNLVAQCKALVDGIVEAGALRDDAPADCTLEVRQEKGSPCTVLELSEDGP